MSFPEPTFLSAKRVMGTVLTEIPKEEAAAPPALERRASIVGNILVVSDTSTNKELAYTLQRKIKDSLHGGSVHVGFVLQPAVVEDKDEAGFVYELVPDETNGGYQMVAIKLISPKAYETGGRTELACLQWITSSNQDDSNPSTAQHLLGPTILAKADATMYAITPFHKQGSLFDYCGGKTLPENEARYLFKQILLGLEELHKLQLCHCSLSLDTVLLNGPWCSFSHWGHAFRISTGDSAQPAIPSSALGGTQAQYTAPEMLSATPSSLSFDGYALDMWSAGIMLFQMICGQDALFSAPLPEDPHFDEICVKGNLRGELETAGVSLSESAVDLLQKMLTAKPEDRLSLESVLEHAWVVDADAVVPSRLQSGGLLQGE